MAEATAPALSLPTQIAYGVGQIAGQVFRDVPSLLLLFFMTSVLGVSPALAGSAIFLPKLIGGALIIGLILTAFGFDAAAARDGPQPASALTGILIAFALAPAACNMLAAAIFTRWGRANK